MSFVKRAALMTQTTPKGFRLHIGLFGRRNVGKSSLLNAITRQQVSIVSETAGTTTDPVEKPMELLPLGPVLFIDTAGIDDIGALGEKRVAQTQKVFERTDLGIIVTDGIWGPFEQKIRERLQNESIPVIAVLNKSDLKPLDSSVVQNVKQDRIAFVQTAATQNKGILELRQAILESAPADFLENPVIVSDIVGPGQTAVLVIPIDKEAPKGRLILPQVQVIRDLLEGNAACVVVKESELSHAFDNLRTPPRLVVTDSQAFLKVAADTPADVWMTSFSILYARLKGDLITQTIGAMAVEHLKPGDSILVAEACSHHPIGEDIGRIKIPQWLSQCIGGKLSFTTVQGRDFPADVTPFKLVIHCGACMWNRRQMLSRILQCRKAGVPITNYGLVIAYSLGIFERALQPFPAALEAYRQAKENAGHA
ncbi:MAG: [FeFe] hydrogenase H-cluster maturation GTPase HydF [Sedimentisphaerales bacterium]|nr:[FeFe] hydrogenase H-cluster maturation GTPase HydF [Sedimentisphaerales bacterium]